MRLMQFLRCVELMQRGEPVSVARIAACTRTSRESVRAWMMMLAGSLYAHWEVSTGGHSATLKTCAGLAVFYSVAYVTFLTIKTS